MQLFLGENSMKKKLVAVLGILLFSAMLTACSGATKENVKVEEKPAEKGILDGLTIVLDAGHGGFDIGTHGIATGVPESEVNLQIAKLLQNKLEEEGVDVVMTREGEDAIAGTKEEDMQKRADIIRAAKADIMISIHQNRYGDSDVYGPQVFYLMKQSKAETLAQYMQEALNNGLEIKKPRVPKNGEYKILRPGTGPSIIIECGFLSNPREDKLLQDPDYQKKLVSAIIAGLKGFAEKNLEIDV